MLVKKVKLTEIGEIISYPKKENGNIVKTADGKDVLGYRRQVLFESLDFRKDSFIHKILLVRIRAHRWH